MGSAVRRLLPYVLRYHRSFSLGLLCVLISTSIQLLAPWVLKHAIDDLGRGVTRGKLAVYASLLLGIAFLLSAAWVLSARRRAIDWGLVAKGQTSAGGQTVPKDGRRVVHVEPHQRGAERRPGDALACGAYRLERDGFLERLHARPN